MKKKKTLLLVIVFIVIIVICILLYHNIPNSSPNMSQKIPLDDERFYKIYQKLQPYTYSKNRMNGIDSFTTSELTEIALTELNDGDFKFEEEDGINYYSVDKEKLDDNLKKYFGQEINVDYDMNQSYLLPNTHFDDGSGFNFIRYDKDTNRYIGQFGGIGGLSFKPKLELSKIFEAVIKDEIITIKEHVIYYKNISDPYDNNQIIDIYSDRNMQEKIDRKVYNSENIDEYTISVDDYLDKATTIITTFKKDKKTNTFYFEKSYMESDDVESDIKAITCNSENNGHNMNKYVFYFTNGIVNEIKYTSIIDYSYYFSEKELKENPCVTSNGQVYYSCDWNKYICNDHQIVCNIGYNKDEVEVSKYADTLEKAKIIGLDRYYGKNTIEVMSIAKKEELNCEQ